MALTVIVGGSATVGWQRANMAIHFQIMGPFGTTLLPDSPSGVILQILW
jgi:hypothetical protein